jgi:hypothetical protein
MPFQVTLCVSDSVITPITVKVDPIEIFAPCSQTLTLEAVVISGRPEGHTFLWELVSGPQVVFITDVNQLTVTCDLLSISSDRIFKCTIDKERKIEQVHYFQFWATAVDRVLNQFGNKLITSDLFINNGTPTCNTIAGTQAIFDPTPQGQSYINSTNLMITWSLPANLSGLQSIHVEQDINGIWTNILDLLPTDTQILYNASNNNYYRIKTIYKIDNIFYSQYSCVYYLYINLANYNGYIDDKYGWPSNAMSINITNYTLLNIESVSGQILDIMSTYGAQTLNITNVTNYTLLNLNSVSGELLDIVSMGGTHTLNITNVVYYGGTVIGSG